MIHLCRTDAPCGSSQTQLYLCDLTTVPHLVCYADVTINSWKWMMTMTMKALPIVVLLRISWSCHSCNAHAGSSPITSCFHSGKMIQSVRIGVFQVPGRMSLFAVLRTWRVWCCLCISNNELYHDILFTSMELLHDWHPLVLIVLSIVVLLPEHSLVPKSLWLQ